METILEFDNVSFYYINGGKQINILKEVNVGFEKGVFYSVIGPSGSGKTTALALAAALDDPKSGQILHRGKDIKKSGHIRHRRNTVSLIFQSYNLLNYLTALENVVMAMEISGSYRANRKETAARLLEEMGLTADEAKRNVLKLSGGQQQRVAIARAIASDSEIILADEPTGNLDVNTAKEIIEIFKKLAHDYNKCVIVVSHSKEVEAACDISYSIEDGLLIRKDSF
jgi:putative ABC transport system ATP-binding protein